MKLIILAGGSGKRLFPLSRINYPKQFLKINSNLSLLAQTIERFSGVVHPKDIVVVTNKEFYYLVKESLASVDAKEAHIVSEPSFKNTAPAITLAIKYIIENFDYRLDESIFVAPSDHIIRPKEDFLFKLSDCFDAANKGMIVTLSIKPTRPDSNYGYIRIKKPYFKGYYVEKFIEKPDLDTATKYFNDGSYYWNSGMYVFTIQTFEEELKRHDIKLYGYLKNKTFQEFIQDFDKIHSISIDYAIAEKTDKLVTIPMNVYWNDLGSFDSMFELLPKDARNNAVIGNCELINCKNSLVISDGRVVVANNVEDIVLVETDDLVLVSKRKFTSNVRDLYDKIEKKQSEDLGKVVYRPWGKYRIINKGEGYKVKKISLNPGSMISLQLHKNRSEHWIIINGVATVIIDGKEKRVYKNQSVFVPVEIKHRLVNNEDEILEIIEIQSGEYIEEDDIIRFDDVYIKED